MTDDLQMKEEFQRGYAQLKIFIRDLEKNFPVRMISNLFLIGDNLKTSFLDQAGNPNKVAVPAWRIRVLLNKATGQPRLIFGVVDDNRDKHGFYYTTRKGLFPFLTSPHVPIEIRKYVYTHLDLCARWDDSS